MGEGLLSATRSVSSGRRRRRATSACRPSVSRGEQNRRSIAMNLLPSEEEWTNEEEQRMTYRRSDSSSVLVSSSSS